MGKFKETVILEVWRYLLTQSKETQLCDLCNHAAKVKQVWAECQQHAKEEGMKKSTGLKQVLSERLDLFNFLNEKGSHPLIVLTEAARILSPDDGYPDKTLTAALPAAADLEGDDTNEAPLKRLRIANPKAAPKSAVNAKASPKAVLKNKERQMVKAIDDHDIRRSSTTPVWTKAGYQDIIWSPEIAAKKELLVKQEKDMVRALYEAICNHPGNKAPIQSLGQDFKVGALKKEPQFANKKFNDLLAKYEDVFEIIEDGFVRPQPGAEAALPDAEEVLELPISEEDLLLPDRIEEPMNTFEKMQALRIEIIRSMHRRGGKVTAPDLGQEPRVQHRRQGIQQAQKVFDFMKIFPVNFAFSTEAGYPIAELISFDVEDTTMIEASIARNNAAYWSSRPATWVPSGSGLPKDHVPRKVPPRKILTNST